MIDFAPGMRTIIRDEEWMVKKIETNSLGNKTLYCVGISPLVKDREAIFLMDLEEIQIVDPAEVKLVADTSPFYKRALLYLESQWRQQIPTDANLHIGHKAAMDLMPYQLDPAKLALQRPRQRILIADTVGLGKTLEAGILMSELIARGKGKRILVVTVKSMMTQFQKEMWNRFTIPLVRLDSNRIQKIRANLPSNYNPFFYYDKTIVSIDTLKRDVEYRTHLENAYWDIIVIDEAQNVAERGDHQAQRSRLAKLLADRSDTMIMLSATPHDGRAKSFASLMNMLDPTAIADPQNYTPEDIKGLCIRRFKKDVKDQVSGSFLERKITLERCNASAKEEYAFDIFAEMQLEMDLGKTKGTGQLFKTSLEKSLFSSPAACIKSIEARLKKLYKKYTADDIKDIHLLENLKTALEAITPADFTRYQKLLDLIRSKEYAWNPADSGDRVVIFTERIETMKYLAERLRKDLGLKANAIQEISGGMSDAEQQRIVEDFGRTESPVRVLVASDVASEGLNLHYLSHRLIHFDIPWSLMVFQQRNGRIDRYGQQNRPDIRYMLIESDNNGYMLSNDRNRWLPGRQSGRNTPRFIAEHIGNGRASFEFDSPAANKYVDWIASCCNEVLVDDSTFRAISKFILDEAVKQNVISLVPSSVNYKIYGLNKERVFITDDVMQMRCDKCGSVYAVAAENAELWLGAPCQRTTCGGFLEEYESGEINYYGRLYSAGDLVRINAREHTGLLERPDREQLEIDFKRSKDTQEIWDPNVLSCTPTLEMGIDIGDLSTVILCSMPPAQSQFLQRAGRAGRKDGNALTLAVANARPHDLYFYSDPLDMIAGEVTPPKIFLRASAVLERQFVAFCMDSWVKKGIPDGAIPDKVGIVLKKLDACPDDMFPFNFLNYVQSTLSRQLNSFMQMFGFMTAEQAEDKKKLEKLGWRILNLLDIANMDVASYFGGDNQ